MKRVIIAVFVPDEAEDADVATWVTGDHDFQDPTVWEWSEFWKDVDECIVGPTGDWTVEDGWLSPDHPTRQPPTNSEGA